MGFSKSFPRVGLVVACLFSTSACGPAVYTSAVLAADNRLEQARADNAQWYAPYEFHMAEAQLEKAQEEAAEASYEEAIRFARAAEAYAKKSLDLADERRGEQ